MGSVTRTRTHTAQTVPTPRLRPSRANQPTQPTQAPFVLTDLPLLLLATVFVGGMIVRLYEDISTNTSGSKELAYRFLGLKSSEEAVVGMILVAFLMILVLLATLFAETYMHVIQLRLEAKYSVATMDPPKVSPTSCTLSPLAICHLPLALLVPDFICHVI